MNASLIEEQTLVLSLLSNAMMIDDDHRCMWCMSLMQSESIAFIPMNSHILYFLYFTFSLLLLVLFFLMLQFFHFFLFLLLFPGLKSNEMKMSKKLRMRWFAENSWNINRDSCKELEKQWRLLLWDILSLNCTFIQLFLIENKIERKLQVKYYSIHVM